MCKTITSKNPNGNSIFGKNERYLHRLNISYKQRGLGSVDIISKKNKNLEETKMAKELGRYPATTVKEVIERITAQLTERVSYQDKLTYVSLVERSLKRPIDWSIDEVDRIYDDPIVKNDTIFISCSRIKEGAIKVVQKNNDFYCRFYNYGNDVKKYIFDQEEVYSTSRCMVEIFGGCADLKIDDTEAYKNLGCAMAVQEAEAYLDTNDDITQKVCIKTLEALDNITEGMSSLLVRKLKESPNLVRERLVTYTFTAIEKRKQAEKNKTSA